MIDLSTSPGPVVHLAFRREGEVHFQRACMDRATLVEPGNTVTCSVCVEIEREEVAGEPVIVTTIDELVQSGVIDVHDVMLLAGVPSRA